jgi:hypothetical protein
MKQYRYRLTPQEADIVNQYRAIKKQANILGLDDKDVKHGWLKNKEASLFFKNPNFETEFDIEKVDFEKLFTDVPKIEVTKVKKKDYKGEFDKLVFTDVHVGMDASDKGRNMYETEWNKAILFYRLTEMVNFTLAKQESKILYISDLGDFLDGFNGNTTRGGHSLPQNMSNQEAFDAGFMFKVRLLEALSPHYELIVMRNVCNDNHAGDFAYFVNQAVKSYINTQLKNVQIINQTSFIDWELVGNYCFVSTHGKDTHNLKHGFKAKIDPNQVNKIVGYLNTQQLLNKGYEIIFEKGDSHLYLFDSATSDVFKYYNYPAFSPSSNWVSTNFQLGRSGFVHFNYGLLTKSINEYFFK